MPVFRLNEEPIFPPPHLAEPKGLLAVGGDLSPRRLLAAYRRGIFPWYGPEDPILWWTTDPRLVLFPEEMHVSRRLARVLRSGRFTVTADTAFAEVIAACAGPRRARDGGEDNGTWLVPEMREAYTRLFAMGHAHSVECWTAGAAGPELAGGLYGVALDRVFFGESMFSWKTDASKAALATLCANADRLRIRLIDCQATSRHLLSLGAREIPRRDFNALLGALIRRGRAQEAWRLADWATCAASGAAGDFSS